MDNISIFDLLPEEEAAKYRPQKSTDWKWTFADYPKEKNGLKVFSCFACGGGSTMGYKLAGCEVLGCCEIDPKMNEIYVKNHHPKHNFLMDIRDFNAIPDEELPEELFNLDILDGSPPCTTFSTAGEREKSWGKLKKFREGQKEQTLDDLSFVFIDTVKKLKPKVVVMENVEGLILGEAFGYVKKIYQQFDECGYVVHHWLLKGEQMGIPQTRHRVIFVACRKDIKKDPGTIDMTFNYEKVPYKVFKSEGQEFSKEGKSGKLYQMFMRARPEDTSLADINMRETGKKSYFQCYIVHDDDVLPTIRASRAYECYRYEDKKKTTQEDVIHAQTFPEDYDFIKNTFANISYVCGMSVPPVMMKRIIQRLIEQGVFKYKEVELIQTGGNR
jgi:DNA (cytosine-5)-methyltransferase 1